MKSTPYTNDYCYYNKFIISQMQAYKEDFEQERKDREKAQVKSQCQIIKQ